MRTIDDIIPPSRRQTADPVPASTPPPRRQSERPAPRFPYLTLGVIVGIILIAFAALAYFSSATVAVTPNTVSAAVQTPLSATGSSGNLPYRIITAKKVASQAVASSGTKQESTAASGLITIYNAQTKPQKLIPNTRFATAAGLIFRIHNAVTVPAGSASKPGSITVRAYADGTGSSYNVGPTSFTVPGLAGTSLATLVYARSIAPMTGGASGAVPLVDPAVVVQAHDALAQTLANDLSTELAAEVPTGYLLVPGAATTTYRDLSPVAASSTGSANVRVEGDAMAIIFPDTSLAAAIATSTKDFGYSGEALTLLPSSDLQISSIEWPTASDTPFSFVLTGTATLEYTVDPTRIAAAVAGKTRALAETALSNYPEVKRAVLTLRPFWRQAFPQDPSQISVTIVQPQ